MAPSAKDLLPDPASEGKGASSRKGALVTGSVAIGAFLTGAVLEKARHRSFPPPAKLAPALDAATGQLEIMEGVTRFYHRPGEGTPLVFLHSINVAGSAFDVKPLFDHFAETTNRPLYAPEWLGFGKSDRPPVAYAPGLYQRQLRRFLSECVREPADVVALSLAGEYAVTVANAFPVLIRKLVLIAPTALGRTATPSRFHRSVVAAAGTAGVFEMMYARLISRESLREFYARRIFSPDVEVPDDLIDYAFLTTHTRGAHLAPRRFIQGALNMRDYALRGYENLATPTLIIAPNRGGASIQQFSGADKLAEENPAVTLVRMEAGLLPQWEKTEVTVALLNEFFVPAEQFEETPA